MTAQTKLIIFAFLVLATAFDAIIRNGLAQRIMSTKSLYFLVGAAMLFGYGLSLNLAPIEFHRVVGVYIATLFVMWQIISFIAFRSVPTLPVIVGGALIVTGGLTVAFWETKPA
jgi:small multidrug resistance family-3 protein